MNVLKGKEPERVFYYFNEISKIPHGSGNTKKISDFCVDFAIKQGLSYSQDEKNNVIIKKKKQVAQNENPESPAALINALLFDCFESLSELLNLFL